MSVYTLNLRVFWPLFTCVLTGLVVLHHIAHRLSPEPGLDPGIEAGIDGCSDQGPSVFFSLIKLILAFVLCYLFIRYCSTHPGGAGRGTREAADVPLKSGLSRRELLDDYYDRWVRLSPHVVGHSKANVAKLIGDLVRAGRADVPPESSLAFRGDFLQVGSSYEEHKVGSPDCFDILVPLRVPRGLRLEPRVSVGVGRQEAKGKRRGEGEVKGKGRATGEAEGEVKGKGKARRENLRGKGKRERSSKGKEDRKEDDKRELKGKENGEPKEEGMEEEKEDMREEEKAVQFGGVPRCSLETSRREEWVRKHRAFTESFLRLYPQGSSPERSSSGSVGGGAYRLTPESVLRWFYPAVQRCLAAVRYPYDQRATLSLTLTDDRVQLHLTPRSDYVCCHISMTIRLLPALPLGDGLYLVPTETATLPDTSSKVKGHDQDLWTLYFPRQEQRLLGWLRGRVPQGSCHLKCLQLVKAIRDLAGKALDSHTGALWRLVLSSYALKTAWLRLLLSTPTEAWDERHLVARVEDLLRSLRESLQSRALGHLFLCGERPTTALLPDSVVLPKLVKEAGVGSGGAWGNLWADIPPASLDLVSGRLAYAWTHLHRLIRLGRPQRSSLGLRRADHGHCQHLESD